MDLPRRSPDVLTLEDRQETLVYADVLLLGLHHPDSFFPHGPDDAEDVHVLANVDLLEDSVESYEGSTSADSRAAVHDYRSLVGLNSLPERPNEASQRLRRGWHAEVWPRREVEVLDYSFGVVLKIKYFSMSHLMNFKVEKIYMI